MNSKAQLLIIDDEKIALKNLTRLMQKEGYDVTGAYSGTLALKILDKKEFDVVMTDIKMEKVDGMQILARCRELCPETEVIMITGYASVDSAVEALKKGAYYYISKPLKLDEVRKVVKSAVEKVLLKKENIILREQIEKFSGKVRIITQDLKIKQLLSTAKKVAPTDCNILISGESGTGKELFTRYIHENSKRAGGPFFAINCGAFTEELLANELFGHVKGAFTGAVSDKTGLMETASGGTLFLDEIIEMPTSMQVKLLRAIQEREVLRIGDTKPRGIDVRFIAATNRDVKDAVKNGELREDLFFRLNVVSFHIPPLSERRDDIPMLCHYFLKKFSVIMKKDVTEIDSDMIEILMNYDFPGNVRELENIIERGVALAGSNRIEVSQLPDDLRELQITTFRKKEGRIPSLEDQEEAYIQWVLKEVGGNKTTAAQVLGIDRVSLWRKLKKYGLQE
jgi:DNA-binding NtrC family response regulator